MKVTLLGLFLLGLTLLTGTLYFGIYHGFSPQEFEETIRSWGARGVVCSIGLMIVHSFLPFPAECLAIANGMVYGPIWDTLITGTGAMLGAYLVLFSRFIPAIAFNSVNYAAGLTRISWWIFSWATGIGILPFTVLMVLMGDYMEVLTWEVWALFVVAGLVLGLLFRSKFGPPRRAQDHRGTDRTDRLHLRE